MNKSCRPSLKTIYCFIEPPRKAALFAKMVETLPFFAKVCKVICVLLRSRPARGAWIEIAKFDDKGVMDLVAPRKGRVD